jgi:hypothetical protein
LADRAPVSMPVPLHVASGDILHLAEPLRGVADGADALVGTFLTGLDGGRS